MADIVDALPAKKNITELLFSSVFINLLSLALPFSMLQIYDRILPNEAYGTANVLLIGVGIAIVLELLLRYARSWFLASAAANYEYRVTASLLKRLLNADFSYLESLGSGKILSGLKSVAMVRELYSGQAAVALMDIPFTAIFFAAYRLHRRLGGCGSGRGMVSGSIVGLAYFSKAASGNARSCIK